MMPLIGIISGGIDFTDLILKVGEAEIKYGSFLQNIIDFLIIAISIFFFIKLLNKLTRKKTKEEVKPIISDEVKLLTEIRDLLKKQH